MLIFLKSKALCSCRAEASTNSVSQPRSHGSQKASGCAALTRETAVVIVIRPGSTCKLLARDHHRTLKAIDSMCSTTRLCSTSLPFGSFSTTRLCSTSCASDLSSHVHFRFVQSFVQSLTALEFGFETLPKQLYVLECEW